MNGLVAYGSSDEEDNGDDSSQEAPRKGIEQQSKDVSPTATNGHHASTDGNLVDIATKWVGPTMPNDTASEQYEEDSVTDVPAMPERDLLRYLTQPSHPPSSMPPEPTGLADPTVTTRFQRFLELKSKGVHFNEDLLSKKAFRNPNLFALLLERADLPPMAQQASLLPASLYDANDLPAWAYKEELLKTQQSLTSEMEHTKKTESAAGKRTIHFAPARLDDHSNPPTKRKRP